MGIMKDFDIRIRNGGDDAIAAVAELWEAREKILFDITDAFTKARWIPVGERLPKDESQVLVYCIPRDSDGTPSCAGCDGNGGIISMAWYERLGYGDGEHWVSDGPAPPLFWMPITAPPKDAE